MRYHYTSTRMIKIEDRKYQMLMRTWRNWITYTFLVGIGLDTLENKAAILKN